MKTNKIILFCLALITLLISFLIEYLVIMLSPIVLSTLDIIISSGLVICNVSVLVFLCCKVFILFINSVEINDVDYEHVISDLRSQLDFKEEIMSLLRNKLELSRRTIVRLNDELSKSKNKIDKSESLLGSEIVDFKVPDVVDIRSIINMGKEVLKSQKDDKVIEASSVNDLMSMESMLQVGDIIKLYGALLVTTLKDGTSEMSPTIGGNLFNYYLKD